VVRSLAELTACACRDADQASTSLATGASGAPTASSLVGMVLAYAIPILGAAAIAAVVAQLAQTRTLWLPRRRIDGAPAPVRSPAARAAIDLGGAAAIVAIIVAWLWAMMPRLATLFEVEWPSGALVIAAILATSTIALVVIATVDAIVRHVELAAGLRMTPAERREDVRQAGMDPRWRRRASARDELGHATVLVLGNGVAAAIAWDPIHRPVPVCVAQGRGTEATRLLGLARRDRVPVHRDVELAAQLVGDAAARPRAPQSAPQSATQYATQTAAANGPGAANASVFAVAPIDMTLWPRLAEIVAAVRRDPSQSPLASAGR